MFFESCLLKASKKQNLIFTRKSRGLGSKAKGSRLRVQGLGLRVQGLGFRVYGLGFGVRGLGFRSLGFKVRASMKVAVVSRRPCAAFTVSVPVGTFAGETDMAYFIEIIP